jgi:acyl-CoA synthetase (AMP-forming)/AMP-acid ligase II
MDARSYFRITKQDKETIFRSGEPHFPAEIKNVFTKHSDVMKVPAVGLLNKN